MKAIVTKPDPPPPPPPVQVTLELNEAEAQAIEALLYGINWYVVSDKMGSRGVDLNRLYETLSDPLRRAGIPVARDW